MKVNRRDFVRMGTVGTVGVLGWGASCPHKGDETPSLQIRIQGLCIVERLPNAANVHLVDGDLLNLGPHETTLTLPTSLVDDIRTTPDLHYLTDQEGMRVYNLTGRDLRMESSGNADLTFDDGPIPACLT